ncbi:MAG TPA: hypothetical protein VHY77_08780, partial [Acidimicrobiales bacterium]|nr:hypothetical protein [Acidimicrobiales bacterium]
RPVVGMTATPDGQGYWLVASDGGVFTFGDAGFFGSTGGGGSVVPTVGLITTPRGNGYAIVVASGALTRYGG